MSSQFLQTVLASSFLFLFTMRMDTFKAFCGIPSLSVCILSAISFGFLPVISFSFSLQSHSIFSLQLHPSAKCFVEKTSKHPIGILFFLVLFVSHISSSHNLFICFAQEFYFKVEDSENLLNAEIFLPIPLSWIQDPLLTPSREIMLYFGWEWWGCSQVEGVSYRPPGTQLNLLNNVSLSLPDKRYALMKNVSIRVEMCVSFKLYFSCTFSG